MEKIYYERNLPHWEPKGANYFLTYRLYGSIPVDFLRNLKQQSLEEFAIAQENFTGYELETKRYEIQRKYFGKYDAFLDDNPNEPYWLSKPEIAQLVIKSLRYCEEQGYFRVWAYCIMPNHVHLLVKHHEAAPLLHEILQRHKSFTGKFCNRQLNRSGHFWQSETYDHVVRDQQEFDRIAQYILNNPVKAKFVEKWEEYQYNFQNL